MVPQKGAAEGSPLCGGGRRPPAFVDGHEAIRLFGHEAIRLSVSHVPWNVNLVDFQQTVLFNLGPHITVPILAFQNKATLSYSQKAT